MRNQTPLPAKLISKTDRNTFMDLLQLVPNQVVNQAITSVNKKNRKAQAVLYLQKTNPCIAKYRHFSIHNINSNHRYPNHTLHYPSMIKFLPRLLDHRNSSKMNLKICLVHRYKQDPRRTLQFLKTKYAT